MKRTQAQPSLRYAYIKNGDVADQVARVLTRRGEPVTSGPDAFIADFLGNVRKADVLLISRGTRDASFEADGVEAFTFNGGSGFSGKLLRRGWTFMQVVGRLMAFRPDRILCGSTASMLWACYLVSRLFSIPLVHSRHNWTPPQRRWYHAFTGALDYWCMRRAAGVICHGPYLENRLLALGLPRSAVCSFDVRFNDLRVNGERGSGSWNRKGDEASARILFVGRLEANKGVLDLLEACRGILAEVPSLKLVYAGAGPGRAGLETRIAACGLHHRVELMGEVAHESLGQIIAAAAVVVTPTRPEFPEGRCMAAMEALAMGVPVVAPDFGPFPFLVAHGQNGLLFEPGSIAGLEQAIRALLTDENLYAKVKSGARRSGAALRRPGRTFAEAVENAFVAGRSRILPRHRAQQGKEPCSGD